MTKTFLLASVSLSLYSYLYNHNVWPAALSLDWDAVKRGQLWRLATCFLYFGKFGLSYGLTFNFLWTYMSSLEKINYKTPDEFFLMILFGAVGLLSTSPFFGISADMLGHGLSSFLVYIWSRIYEGQQVNFMDLFVIRAEYIPWAFLMQAWLLEGESPVSDIVSLVIGWVYIYLKQRNLLSFPAAVQNLFRSSRMRRWYKVYEKEFE